MTGKEMGKEGRALPALSIFALYYFSYKWRVSNMLDIVICATYSSKR